MVVKSKNGKCVVHCERVSSQMSQICHVAYSRVTLFLLFPSSGTSGARCKQSLLSAWPLRLEDANMTLSKILRYRRSTNTPD